MLATTSPILAGGLFSTLCQPVLFLILIIRGTLFLALTPLIEIYNWSPFNRNSPLFPPSVTKSPACADHKTVITGTSSISSYNRGEAFCVTYALCMVFYFFYFFYFSSKLIPNSYTSAVLDGTVVSDKTVVHIKLILLPNNIFFSYNSVRSF